MASFGGGSEGVLGATPERRPWIAVTTVVGEGDGGSLGFLME